MNTACTRRRRRAVARTALATAVAVVAVGCVPPSEGGSTTTTTTAPASTTTTTSSTTTSTPVVGVPPTITTFTATNASGPSPLTTAFSWAVSDGDGDPMTCSLDADGDGLDEITALPCSSNVVRAATISSVGAITSRLSVSDGNNVTTATTQLTVSAPSADRFDLDLVVGGTFTTAERAEIDAAAARVEGVVRGGLPDSSVSVSPGDCPIGSGSYAGPVDDIVVLVGAEALPGSGVAQGAVCTTQTSGGVDIPTSCAVVFDSDELPLLLPGELNDIATHELLHCLGFGSAYGRWGSLSGDFSGPDPRWSGVVGRAEWQRLGGAGLPPLEIGRGPGSDFSHWRESVFGNELMTSVSGDGPSPLSRLTVAALADLGYTVDLNAAEAYSLPSAAVRRSPSRAPLGEAATAG